MIESLRKATSKLATVGDATQDGSDVPDQDGINRDSTRSRHGPRRILVVMITSIYLLGTMEKYEITALEGVTILAYMPTTKLVTRSGFSVAMATSEKKWLKLTAGEKRNVGLVVGVHPDCLPSYTAMKTDDGYTSVQIESYSPESLPQVFYGLFSLACNY